LELTGAMLATWFYEINVYNLRETPETMIAGDFAKLLSAIVIFAVFTLTKDIRFLLLQKYLTFNLRGAHTAF